jgi:hypothetical protein
MKRSIIRRVAIVCATMNLVVPAMAYAQDPTRVRIVVLQGDGTNNISAGTTVEPIVQVQDALLGPLSGARVIFTTPTAGPSAYFPGGRVRLDVFTDADGIAVGQGLRSNSVPGQFRIDVQAIVRGVVAAQTAIAQSNVGAPPPTAPAPVYRPVPPPQPPPRQQAGSSGGSGARAALAFSLIAVTLLLVYAESKKDADQ